MRFDDLSLRTHFALLDGEVELTERDDYVAARSPGNPTHHWGNLLIFRRPPGPGDAPRWFAAFERELGDLMSRHVVFAWEGSDGREPAELLEPFVRAGMTVDHTTTLGLRPEALVRPPRWNDELVIEQVTTDAGWAEVIELQVANRDPEFTAQQHRTFATAQARRYRALVDDGRGAWFVGRTADGDAAGSMGIFRVDDEVARFQAVDTHPDHRRKGVCSRMVYDTCEWAYANLGTETLTMVADSEYHAAAIYESVGFRPVERSTDLYWHAGLGPLDVGAAG